MTTSNAGSWLPDPNAPDQLRWHDGNDWTEHTHPRADVPGKGPAVPSTIPVTTASVTVVHAIDPRPSAKGKAVASMVLGICGLALGLFCWPVGIVCCLVGLPLGLSARRQIADPDFSDDGRGAAAAGVVMSLIGLGLAVIGMVLIGGFLSALSSGG